LKPDYGWLGSSRE